MKRSLRDWPVRFEETLQEGNTVRGGGEPRLVSFIIGHRGTERLPHLLSTLRSIAAQRGAEVECIVVEQSTAPQVRDHLPPFVRYIHTPLPDPEFGYCRSWAFNVGARAARGTLLVLHDNDLVIPEGYARNLLHRQDQGYEVINIKRFIFYLGRADSELIASVGAKALISLTPEVVLQNAEAGGSVAVDRDGFFRIGGFDESFVGWGGEDNEFWERARTLSAWVYGYVPLIHLWHAPQPGKRAVNGNGALTANLIERRASIPPSIRITELRRRHFGNPDAPIGTWI